MMTIDEAIKHCEEVAEEKESICNVIENKGETWTDSGKNYYDICKKCASEHRQLAKWLRELKAYREAYEKIKKLPIRYNEVQGITRCLNIIEDCLGEENADEDSD